MVEADRWSKSITPCGSLRTETASALHHRVASICGAAAMGFLLSYQHVVAWGTANQPLRLHVRAQTHRPLRHSISAQTAWPSQKSSAAATRIACGSSTEFVLQQSQSRRTTHARALQLATTGGVALATTH